VCVHAAAAADAERRIGRVGGPDPFALHRVVARRSSANDIA
jgi:hypothetical protein